MTGSSPLVVVLCGGTSRRFGAGDKTAAVVQHDSTTVLDRILLDLPDKWPVVCVGDRRPTVREVSWRREEPPFGGPVAAVAAGISAAGTARNEKQWIDDGIVVVLAGDQPFAGSLAEEIVAVLLDAPSAEGVVAITSEQFPQHLLGAYRTSPLRRVVKGRANVSVRSTLGTLDLLTHSVELADAMDIDTLEDLARARSITGQG